MIKIVDDTDAEKTDFLVCAGITKPLILPDNLIGQCHECSAPVQFRPHAPKRAKPVCFNCVLKSENGFKLIANGLVTKKSMSEFTAHIKGKKH